MPRSKTTRKDGSELVDSKLRHDLVGRFLRERRIKAGLTQADIAREIGYTTAQFVSNWERGLALPPLEALPRVAALLKIPSAEIIEVLSRYQEAVSLRQKKRLVEVFKRARS